MLEHTCLIVNDDPAVRRYVHAVLGHDGLQSLEAPDAAAAIRIVEQREGRIDLIVSDIKMPGEIDGIDLAYSVRERFPAIPVVLITGFGQDEVIEGAGRDFPLVFKPFRAATFQTIARQAMATRE